MGYISEAMPKDKDKIAVQAHLTPEEHKAFMEEAERRQWSAKKLTENIIREFLQSLKVKKKS